MIPLRDNISSKKFPAATLLLLLANAGVFAYLAFLPPRLREEIIINAAVIPANLFPGSSPVQQSLPPHLTLVTSLFIHGGFLHIAGNMLFLWIFGDNIEDSLGHLRFAGFYLVCGVIASLTHIWHAPDSGVPLIGASGAVSGIMGAYLLFFPKARIQTLVFIGFFITTVKIPALIFIGIWAALQFANMSLGTPGIAWLAHIGGFAAGITAGALMKRSHGKNN